MTKHIPPFVQDDIKKMLLENPELDLAKLQRALAKTYQVTFSEGQLKKFFKQADTSGPAIEPQEQDIKEPTSEGRPYDEILYALYKRMEGRNSNTLPNLAAEFPTSFEFGALYVSSILGPVVYLGEQSIEISGYGESRVRNFETVFADKSGKQKQSLATTMQSSIRKPMAKDQIDAYFSFLLNVEAERPKDVPRVAKKIVEHFKQVSDGVDIANLVKTFTYLCTKIRSEDKTPAAFEYQFREKAMNRLAAEFAAIHGHSRDLCRQMLDQETRLPAGFSFRRMHERACVQSGATNIVSLFPRPR